MGDDPPRLSQALDLVLSGHEAALQRCRVHLMMSALAQVPRRQHQMVAAVIQTAFAQESQREAHRQWRENAETLRRRFRRLAEPMVSSA